jgi:hypothetical protein
MVRDAWSHLYVGGCTRLRVVLQGLTLLTLGPNDMVGEHSLGFKEPEVVVEDDPTEASKKFVEARVRQRLAAAAGKGVPRQRAPRAPPTPRSQVRPRLFQQLWSP